MREDEIKLEIRLAAIEYLLTSLAAKGLLVATGGSEAAASALMKGLRENTRTALSQQTFPGADPALGDHVSDELQHAVDRLLSGIEELLAAGRAPRK
jgi:hypothetical protein